MNSDNPVFSVCKEKPAIVLGGNGFVGSHTTRQLLSSGRKTRVMVRSSSNLRALEGLDVEKRIGDVYDKSSMIEAMRGCGTLFYCVVDTRAWLEDPAPLYRCNVEGLQNALDAAVEAGVQRVVFTSTMATIGLNKSRAVTECDEFNWHDSAPDYVKSRVEAERLFFEHCKKHSLSGTALCIANTYGPMDFQPTPHGEALWNAATGKSPYALNCSAPTVDIRDAARAMLLAEQMGADGHRYIVSNEYLPQADMLRLAIDSYQRPCRQRSDISDTVPEDIKIKVRIIGMKTAYLMATISEWVAKLRGIKDVKLCRKSIYLSEVFGEMDSSKLKDDLGWKPRPLHQTIDDAVLWYRENHST